MITIFKPENTSHSLGMTNDGNWVVFSNEKLFVLEEFHSYLYAMWLLEYRLDDIISDSSMKDEFDFLSSEIIRFVFENSSSSYWIGLAFNWYDGLSVANKIKFKEHLQNLMNSQNLSQKIRHKAKRRYFEL